MAGNDDLAVGQGEILRGVGAREAGRRLHGLVLKFRMVGDDTAVDDSDLHAFASQVTAAIHCQASAMPFISIALSLAGTTSQSR